MDTSRQTIPEFYSGKCVLITGATGFMGKVLVEKLLRSCPNIANVYVLLRQKRGQSGKERLEDFINCQVFDRIRDSMPSNLSKVKLISGDILKDNLSLSDNDRNLLRDSCQIVFHCAACVRFDQKLKQAVAMNTLGTRRVLELVETFKNIQAFLHVSTTYNNCDLEVLEEKVYPSKHDPNKVIEVTQWLDDELLDTMTQKMIEPQPNTYAYTKGLTEELLLTYEGKFPIVIARPAIVTAAWKEPMPGWVENLNGPTGILVGAGKGVIRSMHCEESYSADVIPVDFAINACIILAYRAALNKNKSVEVCNIAESGLNPVTWGEALEYGRQHVYIYPFSVCMWYPGGSIKSYKIVHDISVIFLHMIPAYIIDILLFVLGKKTFMVKIQKRISGGLQVLQYYTTKQWRFRNENFATLAKDLVESDRVVFYTDVTKINWCSYLKSYILGAREYCCKEDPATLTSARQLLKRLYYLDKATQLVLLALFFWFASSYIRFMTALF